MKILFYLVLSCSVYSAYGQEICDNAIDDDGDGLIDLNDDECDCIQEPELILNADFESYSCCPAALGDINCLNDGWTAGYTGATADYYNTCGFVGGNNVPIIPLPVPSGEGAVGILGNGNYLETVGTCLGTDILQAGITYTLSFYMAVPDEIAFFNITLNQNFNLYGTTDCSNLPLSSTNTSPCMSNDPNWSVIGNFSASGTAYFAWTLIEIEFTPAFDVSAIALGHQCPAAPTSYTYLDNISIFEQDNNENAQEILSNGDCLSGVNLEVDLIPGTSYQWYLDGVAIIGATSNSYEIPTADKEGVYQVVTSNGLDCEISPPIDVMIDEMTLDISANVLEIQCELLNNGVIDITPQSNNAPFTYEWNNGFSEEDILNGEEGYYSVTVTDANGCMGQADFLLENPPTIEAFVFGDCIAGTSILVPDDILNPGATYQWFYNGVAINGATESVYDIPSDASGEYYVVVSNGEICRLSVPIQVDIDTEVLTVDGQVDQISCDGDTLGQIIVITDGFNPPYQYQWSNGETNQQIDNLFPGEYSITVVDNNGCNGIATFEIMDIPDFNNTLEVVQPSGNTPSSANVVTDGGTPPYSYSWSNGATANPIEDIPPGSYTVTITDSNGCSEVLAFQINSEFMVIASFTDSVCFGQCTGEIEIEIEDGIGTFTIEWTNSNLEGFSADDVCAGIYDYFITNEDNSTFSGSLEIFESLPLDITGLASDTLCTPIDSFIFNSNVTGGFVPYTYLWSDGSTEQDLTVFEVGLYTLTVSDSRGCESIKEYNLSAFDPIEIEVEVIEAGCDGEPTGEILIEVSGGTAPFSYQWSNGDITENINALYADIYSVTITDANGCIVQDSFLVETLESIAIEEEVIDNDCPGDEDGVIEVEVVSGNGPFNFLWSTGATTLGLNDLPDGNYGLTITDNEGCSLERSYSITTQSTIEITAIVNQNICFGDEEGSIDLEIINEGIDYDIIWTGGAMTEGIADLEAGIYAYEVTDEFGCIYVDEFEITEGVEIEYSTSTVDANCNGASDGEITIEIFSGTEPFTFLWNTGSTANSLKNISAGQYTVTITDAVGCSAEETFFLQENSDLEILVNKRDVSCFGVNDGGISLNIEGGAEPYAVAWDNGEEVEQIGSLSAGQYTFTVTDANGCSNVDVVMISQPYELVLDVNQVDPVCFSDFGEIELNISGGEQPYDINWSTGETTESILTEQGSNYLVTITDNNECSLFIQFDTPELEPIEVVLIENISTDATNGTGSIEIIAQGGNGPYSYEWSNGAISPTITGLGVGTYEVIVTDADGCQALFSYSITSDELSVSTNIQNNLCIDECEGSINLEISGGLEPYSIQWSNNEFGTSNDNLCDGAYTVTIIDDQENILIESDLIIESQSSLETSVIGFTNEFIEGSLNEDVVLELNIDNSMDIASIVWNTLNDYECFDEGAISCQSILLTIGSEETVEVVISDSEGCTLTLTTEVRIKEPNTEIFIPNIFSPNGDNVNDEFKINSNNPDVMVNSLSILDRWGNLVYTISDQRLDQLREWDGTFNGDRLAAGVYVYKIEVLVNDERLLFVGDVTLIE